MLVSYRVENYRSFGHEQGLDMTAGPVRNHPSHVTDDEGEGVLSTAIVFGANSSGKSNLVHSIRDSRNMVVSGRGIDGRNLHRTREGIGNDAMSFEYMISLDGVRYSYGFSLSSSDGLVEHEWLLKSTGHESSARVFERNGSMVQSDIRMDPESENVFSVYKGEASNRGELFLRVLQRANESEGNVFRSAALVMEWFERKLIIAGAGTGLPTRGDPSGSPHMGKILSAYGTGISDVRYEKTDPDPLFGRFRMVAGDDVSVERMVFDHNGVPFDFHEESDGTRRLMDLAPLLNPYEGDDLTYVIDELDRSLHPLLTRRLMEDFLGMSTVCRRQLIATVHESGLMDLNLLRRDEIWFTENNGGETELFSLEDFNERGNCRVDGSYLNGRYGAVPCFGKPFPDPE